MPRRRIYASSAARQKAYRKRLKRSVHFSSETDLWSTPESLFSELDEEFHFTLDVCAVAENAKCQRFFTPSDDGLMQPWVGICWMNPPYGTGIEHWIAKAYEASLYGATVVALIPVRTDTTWWQRWVKRSKDIRFLKGRIRFSGAKSGAPFPSAVVVFKPNGNATDEEAL